MFWDCLGAQLQGNRTGSFLRKPRAEFLIPGCQALGTGLRPEASPSQRSGRNMRLSCLDVAGLGPPVKCPKGRVEHPISNC